MGAGLVGDDVGLEAHLPQRRQHVGGVARTGPTLSARRSALAAAAAGDGVVEVVGLLVEVAGLEPPLDPVRVDLDAERHAAVHRHRQRLGAAHAAEPGGDGDRARRASRRSGGGRSPRSTRRCPGGSPGCRCRSRSRRSSARTSSGPSSSSRRNSSQLAQSGTRFELAISTRGAHSWVRKTPTGLPDCTSSVSSSPEAAQGADDRVERLPGARGAAGAAVDDQVVGPLGDLRVEVVHQHPQRRLLRPAPAGELGAARRPDLARAAHAQLPSIAALRSASTASAARRRRPAPPTAASSGASQRSGPGPGTARPHRRQRRRRRRRRRQRRAQVEPAGRAGHLDREDRAARLATEAAQLARRRPAHRDVVLLHRAGRQRVDAGRRREAPVLGDHRRLRVLGDHHPRVDAGVLGQERRQAVRARRRRAGGRCGARRSRRRRRRRSPGSRRRRPSGAPWKLPHDSTRPSGRIIGLSIADAQLGAPPRPRRRRARRGRRRSPAARSAASRRPGPWDRPRGAQATIAEPASSAPQVGGALGLARAGGAARPGPRRRRGRCRAAPRPTSPRRSSATRSRRPQVGDGQDQHPEDAVGAVDQGQALLRPQGDGLDPGLAHRLGGAPGGAGARRSPRPRRSGPGRSGRAGRGRRWRRASRARGRPG